MHTRKTLWKHAQHIKSTQCFHDVHLLSTDNPDQNPVQTFVLLSPGLVRQTGRAAGSPLLLRLILCFVILRFGFDATLFGTHYLTFP